HRHRSGFGDLSRCSYRMGAPVDQSSDSQAAKNDRREYRPSPVRRWVLARKNSNVCTLGLLVPEPAKFDQLTRTLGALQDMQVFWIGEIQLLGRVHPRFQGGMVDTANALRIRVFFEDVL